MSNSKHSPGPWLSLNNFAEGPFFIHKKLETGDAIAEVKIEANARLIAAAPEMLEALESVLNNNKVMNALKVETRRLIMDAVAKARGEI